MGLTATQNAIITKTAQGAFYSGLDARKPSIPVGQFVSTDSLTASSKDFGWFGSPPFPREWVGPRHHRKLRAYTDTLTPKKWELTLDVNRELVEDDQTMQAQLPRIGAALAERAQEHVVKRFTEVLAAGTGSTVDTSWDGQFYFDTDHSFGNSGTVNNDLTHTVVTASDPTAAELEALTMNAIEAMIAFPNDQGDPAGAVADMRYVLMIPPGWLGAAAKTFGPNGALGPGGTIEGDVTGVTGVLRGVVGYIVNTYLPDTDRAYVLRPGLAGAVGPFILQRHAKAPWELNLEEDRETDVYVFRMRSRYEVHYGDFLASSVTVVST